MSRKTQPGGRTVHLPHHQRTKSLDRVGVWEVGTSLLQEELSYYKSRFGYEVLRHHETEVGSRTICGLQGELEMRGFLLSFESKYDGVDSVRRGNDLRYLALPRHWYKGPEDILTDAQGYELVEAPNCWIRLIGADEVPYISLHVADLAKAAQLYSSQQSVTVTSFGPDRAVVSIQGANVNVELVQLPVGQALRRGAGSGRLNFLASEEEEAEEETHEEKEEEVDRVICFSQHREQQHYSSAPDLSRPTGVFIDWAERAVKEEDARAALAAAAAAQGGAKCHPTAVKALQPNDWPSVAASGAAAVIEVLAPWCPLCEDFAPLLERLAAAATPSLLPVGFFSLDGANRRFGFEHAADENLASMLGWAKVAGFPSLFFLPAGSGAPVAYDGPLTLSSVATWVAKNMEVADIDAFLTLVRAEDGEKGQEEKEEEEEDEDCDKCEL